MRRESIARSEGKMATGKNRLVLTAAMVFAAAFVSECALYQSGNGDSCPCKDGWKCCEGSCIPEGEVCSTDGGTGQDCNCIEGWKCCMKTCIPDSAMCPEDGGLTPCSCKNPQDTVDTEGIETVCARKNYTCNALNLCEGGYDCYHSRCACVEPETCGIDCASGCQCPGSTVCDANADACREPLICLDDSMCAGGDVCRLAMDGYDYYRCLSPIANGVGDACSGGDECNSRVCYTNVCLQFCTQNADCPDNLQCAEVDHGELGCVINTECDPPCGGADEYCEERRQECHNDFCRTSGECAGVCAVEIQAPLAGKCLPGDEPGVPDCGDQEFVTVMSSLDGYCIIYRACWSDADCEAPYTCVSTEELGAPTITDAKLCARRVGP
jgi:hypothetical protein